MSLKESGGIQTEGKDRVNQKRGKDLTTQLEGPPRTANGKGVSLEPSWGRTDPRLLCSRAPRGHGSDVLDNWLRQEQETQTGTTDASLI